MQSVSIRRSIFDFLIDKYIKVVSIRILGDETFFNLFDKGAVKAPVTFFSEDQADIDVVMKPLDLTARKSYFLTAHSSIDEEAGILLRHHCPIAFIKFCEAGAAVDFLKSKGIEKSLVENLKNSINVCLSMALTERNYIFHPDSVSCYANIAQDTSIKIVYDSDASLQSSAREYAYIIHRESKNIPEANISSRMARQLADYIRTKKTRHTSIEKYHIPVLAHMMKNYKRYRDTVADLLAILLDYYEKDGSLWNDYLKMDHGNPDKYRFVK